MEEQVQHLSKSSFEQVRVKLWGYEECLERNRKVKREIIGGEWSRSCPPHPSEMYDLLELGPTTTFSMPCGLYTNTQEAVEPEL